MPMHSMFACQVKLINPALSQFKVFLVALKLNVESAAHVVTQLYFCNSVVVTMVTSAYLITCKSSVELFKLTGEKSFPYTYILYTYIYNALIRVMLHSSSVKP